jgi:hypothetical protein
MARYSDFLNRKVHVLYRAGDVILSASATFAADSGRSIFLEQRSEQRGKARSFRWEIPYQYIVRIQDFVEVDTRAGILFDDLSQAAAAADSQKSRAHAVGAFGGASFLSSATRAKAI